MENLEGKTVLIAEDEEFNYYFLEEVLSITNVNILWAKDGQQAIDLFTENGNVDLVLMDIKMPVMSGLESMKKIKEQNSQVKIVAQTAFSLEEEEFKLKKEGFDDFLNKPIDIDMFMKKIEDWLS